MNYLSQGLEKRELVDLLLSLTKIKEPLQDAIVDHLVRGLPVGDAALINDVRQPHLSRALTELNKVAEKVEKINELKIYTS